MCLDFIHEAQSVIPGRLVTMTAEVESEGRIFLDGMYPKCKAYLSKAWFTTKELFIIEREVSLFTIKKLILEGLLWNNPL